MTKQLGAISVYVSGLCWCSGSQSGSVTDHRENTIWTRGWEMEIRLSVMPYLLAREKQASWEWKSPVVCRVGASSEGASEPTEVPRALRAGAAGSGARLGGGGYRWDLRLEKQEARLPSGGLRGCDAALLRRVTACPWVRELCWPYGGRGDRRKGAQSSAEKFQWIPKLCRGCGHREEGDKSAWPFRASARLRPMGEDWGF